MKFLTNLDLCKNELQNARIQNLTSHPSSPVLGQIYYNTIDNAFYGWDGSKWINLGLELNFHEYTSLIESADNDELVIYDVSDGLYKKITKQNLLAGIANDSQYVLIKKKEEFIATEGQTVFNLTQGSYETGTNRVDVYIWGTKQPPTAYTELSSTSIQLAEAVEAGTKVLIEYIQLANVMDYIHAENHKIGGSDPLSPADIGAANEVHTHSISDITNLQTTLNNKVDTSEVTTTATANKILKLNSSGKLPASITGNADGNAATATKLQTARTISITGDATGSTTFNGSANASINVTLSNSGVTAGTYTKVTADSKGRVTSGTTLSASDIPTLTSSKISDFDTQVRKSTLNQMAAPTADVSMNNKKITNVADPINPQDAATKNYVDTIKQGLDVKDSVRVATTSNLSATYSSGVLTASSNGVISIDGVTLALNDRVLVKNQSDAKQNGIYYVSQVGSSSSPWKLTRAPDADTSDKVTAGLYVWVTEGNTNADSGWILTTNDPITLDTSTLTFTQFSGAGMITAGTGLQKNGNTISLTNTGVTAGTYPKVTVDSQGRVTAGSSLSASDIPNLSWTKITSDKPTTLSGYGITDAVSSSDITTTPTANKILKLDANAKLPASITGNADGNAATATKLQTARTISLSGDVTGSANFDGSSNITINATVVDDSHNHVISNIDNLQSTLDAKASVSHTHTSSEITDFNEATQDAIGAILTDTSTIDFTYDDTNNQIKADVKPNSSNQKVAVSKNSTTPTGTRKQINFKDGTNISVTVADNATNDAVDVTITNTYTHPTGDGNLHVPATGTTNNNKVLKAGSTAGSLSWGNVDWSELTNKPSSSVSSIDNAVTNSHTHSNKALLDTYTQTEANLADAVSKKHAQNTDNTLTSSSSNTINTTGTGNIVDFKVNNTTKSSIDNNGNFTGNAATASKLQTARTISISGDITGSTTFDGSNNVSINSTLANSGVTAGTYSKVTVDSKGRVTSGSNITSSDITGTLGYVPAKKYATNIGDGSSTAITVTHNLNTMDVTVLVRENVSPYSQVITDVQIVDTNKIKLLFATAPSSGQYRVVVTG